MLNELKNYKETESQQSLRPRWSAIYILKEITTIYIQSLQDSSLPQDWLKSKCSSNLQKSATTTRQQITVQYH